MFTRIARGYKPIILEGLVAKLSLLKFCASYNSRSHYTYLSVGVEKRFLYVLLVPEPWLRRFEHSTVLEKAMTI